MTTDFIDLRLVKCFHSESGCGWRGYNSFRIIHLEKCGYEAAQAPLENVQVAPLENVQVAPLENVQEYQQPILYWYPLMTPPPNVFNVESTITNRYQYKLNHPYPSGWLKRFGDEQTRFFHYENTEENLLFVLDSARITNTVRTKHLLSIKGVDMDGVQDRIIVCHDYFEDFLQPWLSLKPDRRELFDSDGMMMEFWSRSIKNILQTLQMLHETNMAHGNLDYFESFVIIKEQIYLVLPSKDGSKIGKDGFEDAKEKDFQCVKNLLLVLCDVNETKGAVDWSNFISMFNLEDITAEKLRGHPVLMNGSERAGFMSCACDHVGFANKVLHSKLMIEFNEVATSFCSNGRWDKEVHTRKIPKLVFDYKSESCPEYNPNKEFHLFRFVKNYLHHAGSEVIKYGGNLSFSKKTAGLELSHMFPGYMSFIYTTLVDKFPELNIWVKE